MTRARAGSTNRSSIDRPDDDHYPTPREAVVPLLDHWPLPLVVWEPACGAGDISEILIERGHVAISTNLPERGYGETGVDFLATTEARAGCIVTNPPFDCPLGTALDFILHALDLGVPLVAFLLRTKCLEGAERYRKLYHATPPAVVYQFINRVVFYAGDTPRSEQPGWSNEAFAWFCWDQRRGSLLDTRLRWLWAHDGRQGALDLGVGND